MRLERWFRGCYGYRFYALSPRSSSFGHRTKSWVKRAVLQTFCLPSKFSFCFSDCVSFFCVRAAATKKDIELFKKSHDQYSQLLLFLLNFSSIGKCLCAGTQAESKWARKDFERRSAASALYILGLVKCPTTLIESGPRIVTATHQGTTANKD